MKKLFDIGWKALTAGGGWAPLLVFTIHVFVSAVLHLYNFWPNADIPMHFSGGLAIAFFISRCFQLLPRESVKRSHVVLLELVLIGSLTASAAVFWEFAEFFADQLFGTNVQVSVANIMQDIAMGILGATFLILIRIRQLRMGVNELREITFEWMLGQAA
jgi:hypothetical protein